MRARRWGRQGLACRTRFGERLIRGPVANVQGKNDPVDRSGSGPCPNRLLERSPRFPFDCRFLLVWHVVWHGVRATATGGNEQKLCLLVGQPPPPPRRGGDFVRNRSSPSFAERWADSRLSSRLLCGGSLARGRRIATQSLAAYQAGTRDEVTILRLDTHMGKHNRSTRSVGTCCYSFLHRQQQSYETHDVLPL
jgi:hypothetical protein